MKSLIIAGSYTNMQVAAEGDSQIVKALKQWQMHPSNSQSLHDHLCEMLNNMPNDQLNGLLHFEMVSEYFKKVRFRPTEPLTQLEIQNKANQIICYPGWVIQQQALSQKAKKPKQKTALQILQNFEKQSQTLFQPVGISFGAQQNHKINLSLKLLSQKHNTTKVRFWGKILTKTNDYLVIQGISKKEKEPVISEGMEKYRQGANYYSFWVAQDMATEKWYQLPLITPEQLKIARLVKYVFSGNLKQKIKSYPVFPGEQRHLLKCQLVRITHNCEIVPNGLYSPLEETPEEVDFAEQFKMPEFSELGNLEGWVHLNPYILGMGRSDYYLDPKLSEQQKQQLLAKLQQTDPKIQRLKPINEDKPYEKFGLETPWLAKQVGNLQVFNGKEEGTSNVYGSVTLKNPHWPGWLTVANPKSFGSIYIGYGYKLTQDCFHPSSPEDLQAQGPEIDEFDEPNPKNPPDELQPDSDDENKKQQNS